MDVTKKEDMVAAVEQIKQNYGGLDILINNAGYGSYVRKYLGDRAFDWVVRLWYRKRW